MPTAIHENAYDFTPDKIDTGFSSADGPLCELTTDSILESMDEVNKRTEMDELFRLIMKSNQYFHGKEQLPI